MKTALFIIIVLASGALAGVILGSANLVFVEPYLDQAIGIENQHLFATGEAKDTSEFWAKYDQTRAWQKSGQILAGVILGTAFGSLFGVVFAMSRNSLPGKSDIKKALILAGIIWLTIYFIPFLKYPANPPGVGDPETIALRQILYLSFIVISGFSAFGFYKLSQKLENRKFLALLGYAIFMSIVFVVMPENPDKITTAMDLVEQFRTVSAFTISLYWLSLGLILGSLWHHFKPHKEVTSFS